MTTKSWLITLVPLFMALIGIAYSSVTGNALSSEQVQVIQALILAFIGGGSIGAWHSIQTKKLNN